jgi:hypothetical protein
VGLAYQENGRNYKMKSFTISSLHVVVYLEYLVTDVKVILQGVQEEPMMPIYLLHRFLEFRSVSLLLLLFYFMLCS